MHQRQSAIGVWLSIILGCMFALLSLLLVLFGADAYSSVLNDAAKNDTTRTATLYIANKIRRHDGTGCVTIGGVEDTTALVLKNSIDNNVVITYLYLNDGNLCEVCVLEGTPAKKAAGQSILPLSSLSISLSSQGLLFVSLTDENGTKANITLHLRTAEAAP